MTRDEAKMVLELIRDRYSSVDVDRLSLTDAETDAINMAIEALEQKHGKWIDQVVEDELLAQKCSVCGYLEYVYGRPNYCSNCGADMRKILPKP